jgi:hypothetical protein
VRRKRHVVDGDDHRHVSEQWPTVAGSEQHVRICDHQRQHGLLPDGAVSGPLTAGDGKIRQRPILKGRRRAQQVLMRRRAWKRVPGSEDFPEVPPDAGGLANQLARVDGNPH